MERFERSVQVLGCFTKKQPSEVGLSGGSWQSCASHGVIGVGLHNHPGAFLALRLDFPEVSGAWSLPLASRFGQRLQREGMQGRTAPALLVQHARPRGALAPEWGGPKGIPSPQRIAAMPGVVMFLALSGQVFGLVFIPTLLYGAKLSPWVAPGPVTSSAVE